MNGGVCLSPTGGLASSGGGGTKAKRVPSAADLKRTKSQGSTRKVCKAYSCSSMEDATGALRFLSFFLLFIISYIGSGGRRVPAVADCAAGFRRTIIISS